MPREEPLHGERLVRAMLKAALLRREGKDRDESVAVAMEMERAHRLTDDGRYVHDDGSTDA